MQGKVKFFKSDKGFGFIQTEALDKDVFVHISDCPEKKALERGATVEFEYKETDRGYQATKVTVI